MEKTRWFGRLAGVSMIALAAGAPTAMAQQTDGAEPDRVVVTGFRESLSQALETKREDTGVVDAIVAEDIADFPDLNLAESLQRIPGVSIDRQAGEGRRITVRGLGGNFTRVRINGMEALATSGGSDASGGTNRSRGFDFNTFASELFNELVVRKTQSASVEEGSLGANVELKTAQPFDYGAGLTASASAQAAYNDLSEDTSPRYAGLLSWTNPEENFGLLVSAAYGSRFIREEGFSTVRFDDFGTFGSVGGVPCVGSPLPADCEAVRNSYYARIPRYGRLDYDVERLGLTASAQAQLTPQTLFSFDALYSTFEGEREEEFLEVFVRSNTAGIDLTDFTISPDGVLSRIVGNLNPAGGGLVPARSEHRRDMLETEFKQFTGKLEHEFTDRLRGDVIAGTSESVLEIPVQATIFFDAANPVTGYSYDFTQGMETPFIDFGSLDVTDPSAFLFTQYRNRPQGVDNTYDTVQGNLEFDLNDVLTLSGGLSYKKYEFLTQEARAEGNVANLPGFTDAVPVTDAIANLVTGFGSDLGAPGGIDTSWVTPDLDAAFGLIDLFGIAPVRRDQDTRGVEEEDTGGYIQLDYDTMWGGMPVRGDLGVRYVETKIASTGFLSGSQITIEREYEDWLPAANIVLEVAPDFLVRGGVAKVMARPALGNLTPGGNIDTFTGPPFTVSQGNPGLDPFRATNYDLSLEWYFDDESLLALGLFYKDVDSFFTTSDVLETTFSQTGIPISALSPTSPLAIQVAAGMDPAVEVSQTLNGDSATLQGLELVYQQPFTFLPGALSDFGFVGNYTYVDSDEVIGFSPNAFNATVYYENGPFEARITGAYRDAYQTTRPSSSGRTEGREERGVASTFNLDMSASFNVTENFELTFEALNLTDEFEHQTFDQLDLVTLYHHTGRNFLFGARYTY